MDDITLVTRYNGQIDNFRLCSVLRQFLPYRHYRYRSKSFHNIKRPEDIFTWTKWFMSTDTSIWTNLIPFGITCEICLICFKFSFSLSFHKFWIESRKIIFCFYPRVWKYRFMRGFYETKWNYYIVLKISGKTRDCYGYWCFGNYCWHKMIYLPA